MITLSTGDKKVKLYASIKELPIMRYKLMQSYLLQDSGIGNTIDAIDQRLNNLILFATSGKNDEVITEATNLRYTFFSMLNKIDYKSMSFACLIKEIDSRETNDLTDAGLSDVVNRISDMEDLAEHWEEIKKNWSRN